MGSIIVFALGMFVGVFATYGGMRPEFFDKKQDDENKDKTAQAYAEYINKIIREAIDGKDRKR